MKSALLVPILFSTSFFLVIDLVCWFALKFLFRKKSHSVKLVVAYVHFGALFLVVSTFIYYFLQPQAQRYDEFRTFFSAFVMAFYSAKLLFSLFVLLEWSFQFLSWLGQLFGMNKRKKKRLILQNIEKQESKGMTRADFLYSSGAIAAAAPFYILLRGAYKNAYDYRVRKVKLEIPGLPTTFRGKTIVQLSDIHSGSLSNKDAVYQGVNLVKAINPDIFFFTGDLVNNFAWEANDFIEMFSELKGKMGSYSVLGNHDYGLYHRWESESEMQKNFSKLIATHGEIGWRLLRNENEYLSLGGQTLNVVGVENWGHSMRFPKKGDLDFAKKDLKKGVSLLLSHDPSHWDHVIRPGHPDMHVTFAGHTHGAQFGIELAHFKWSPVQYVYKQWAGLYAEGVQQLYVNRGFGFIGYPGRVGILPEITLFELS